MLDALEPQAPDALLALIKLFAVDERADKIDLGVGVYRTDDGATPVFEAIKQAERRLVDEQESKGYLGPDGDPGFVEALMPLIFGADRNMSGRIAGRCEARMRILPCCSTVVATTRRGSTTRPKTGPPSPMFWRAVMFYRSSTAPITVWAKVWKATW